MPAEWKPDRARFVLSIYPANGFIYGQVDPGSPGCVAESALFRCLAAMAKTLLEEKRHVIMFVGDQATLVMPDEALPLGRMTRRGQFPHRTGLRPERPDVARDKNMSTPDPALRAHFRQRRNARMQGRARRGYRKGRWIFAANERGRRR